jgi:branched-chain amino acid transport system substrate-binding protein
MARIGWVAAMIAAMIGLPAYAADHAVRIGVLGDLTGPYSDLGGPGNLVATKLAVEDFGGKVLGKPIEIVSADMQNKPDVASSIARRWYDEGVDVIVDLGNSAVALAVQNVARDKNKIDIVSAAGTTLLTGKQCSPNGFQWTFDTYALAKCAVLGSLKKGDDSWFFLTVDYAYGHAIEADARSILEAAGGKVVGAVRHPLGIMDQSSFLLQAQGSGAKVIAMANSGTDTINTVKQAAEFGIGRGSNKQRLVALSLMVTTVHSIGLQAAQGLTFAEAFYWDQNEETRAWSKRFMAIHGKAPTMLHAGTYSATLHYLKAVQAAGTTDTAAVTARMRATKINDFMTKDGWIREDGRVMRDMYILQVKTPQESTGEWDLMKVVGTIPAAEAARGLEKSECPLVKR